MCAAGLLTAKVSRQAGSFSRQASRFSRSAYAAGSDRQHSWRSLDAKGWLLSFKES